VSEEFFERLDKVAAEKIADSTCLYDVLKYPGARYSDEILFDLAKRVKNATIEALREMMVGEPIIDKLEVRRGYTGLDYGSTGWLCELWRYDDDLATDGEEVVVLVVRLS